MYARIVNELDYKWLIATICNEISIKEVSNAVVKRIESVVQSLDTYYGKSRTSYDMGGNLFFLSDIGLIAQQYKDILECYNLSENMREYSEVIGCEEKREWICDLYMLSSDDAIVIIYVRERKC